MRDLRCTSDAPDNCPECGAAWQEVECVYTGDSRGVDGYEDWCYCGNCQCELFYPLRPEAAKPL